MPQTKITPVKVYPKQISRKDGTTGMVYKIQLAELLEGQRYATCWDELYIQNLVLNTETEIEYKVEISGQYTNVTILPNLKTPVVQTKMPSVLTDLTPIHQRLEEVEDILKIEITDTEKKLQNRIDSLELKIDTVLKLLNKEPS